MQSSFRSLQPINQCPVIYLPDVLPVANQQYQSTEGKRYAFHRVVHSGGTVTKAKPKTAVFQIP